MAYLEKFYALGKVSNYEMGQLRALPNPRMTRWQHIWCSVSNAFHPVSEEDFKRYMQERDGES